MYCIYNFEDIHLQLWDKNLIKKKSESLKSAKVKSKRFPVETFYWNTPSRQSSDSETTTILNSQSKTAARRNNSVKL